MTRPSRVIVAGAFGFVVGALVSAQLVRGQTSSPLAGGTLTHISFAVRDLDTTAKAFADLFGVQVPPGRFYRDVPFTPGDSRRMHMKSTGFQALGVRFEFLEPQDGENPLKDFFKEHGEGIHHIGVGVANPTQTREELLAMGGKWTQAYNETTAYVDMHWAKVPIPITFEVTGRPTALAK